MLLAMLVSITTTVLLEITLVSLVTSVVMVVLEQLRLV